VPLSDHEQQILAQLEESLSQQDPSFAQRVRKETLYRHAGRSVKWAALGFALGLVLTVLLFSMSVALGFVGVALMFTSAVFFERNLRRVGKAGWHDITRSLHEDEPSGTDGRIEHTVHNVRRWLRDRMPHAEE
jgi:hypothetical protein